MSDHKSDWDYEDGLAVEEAKQISYYRVKEFWGI